MDLSRTDIDSMCVGPIGTNCWFLRGGGKLAVIDPGDQARDIQRAIGRLGAEPAYILLTHGHYDHTTAVPELHAMYPGVPVYIHRADAGGAGNTIFPLAGRVKDLRYYDEGDTLPLGSLAIQVLHTPGHSKGSVTLKAGDALFCGDTLFAGSMGRTDLPGGDEAEIMASLKRLGELEGDYLVCPGHMGSTTLSRERETNFFLRQAMGAGWP